MTKFIFVWSLFFVISVQSQQSVFYENTDNKPLVINKFGLGVYNLNFIKNNEYFNFIADGYTLLGSQFQTEFIYKASATSKFKIGVFFLKNFGTSNIKNVIPTLSYNYLNGNHAFTIGNLDARNNHNMIEPIMASEKILNTEVIENGVEYKYKNKYVKLDLWLNWENYIHKFDNLREVFTIGFSGQVTVLKKKKSEFTIPIQYIYYHHGGQINKKYRTQNNVDSILNFQNKSIGLKYQYLLNKSSSLSFGYYYLNHKLESFVNEYPFKKGHAHYFITTLKIPQFEFSLAYFSANKFISAKGNDMFQTYSVKINNNYWNGILDNRYVNHTEQNRQLLFTKISFKKKLSEAIILGFQAEGFFQLNEATLSTLPFLDNKKNKLDYSYGIYLIFNDVFSF